MTDTKTFHDMGVDGAIADALAAKGITHPFPIQELTLPMALKGADIIGQARTGTGKTLGFGLPLLQRIDTSVPRTQALVVVPTRELCIQVASDLEVGGVRGVTSIAVYGGVPMDPQTEALTAGVHVVVGTPGRLLDHLNRGNLDLSAVSELVLDEADEMLDMGFLPDVERLIEATPAEGRHTMLFSATMPSTIVSLARRYMSHPTFMRAEMEESDVAPTVDQHFFLVHRMDKPRILARILQTPDRGGVYVFTRTKHMADRLVQELEDLGVSAIAIHGDLRQVTREKNLDRFRDGRADVLVATEVAARGLDVENVTHVVNYDCPDDEKMYLHRIGRTARAGAKGVAITFAEFNEVDRLNVIRKAVDARDQQVEEVFSTSDRLQELFDLPDETPWAHLSRKGGRSGSSSRGSSSRGSSSTGGDRGGKRTGSSDGRSRNRRRAERAPERGSDRPSAPAREEAPAGRDTSAGADASASSDASTSATGTRQGAATRTRQRSRTTHRDAASATSSGGRSRTRARTNATGDDRASGKSRDGDEPRERTAGRTEDRGSSSNGGRRSSKERSGSSEERSGSSKERSGSSKERSGSSKERSGSSKGRGSSSKGRNGSSPEDHGGRSKRSGGTSAGGADRAPGEDPTRRGADARGDGSPQLARRVKVEHLP